MWLVTMSRENADYERIQVSSKVPVKTLRDNGNGISDMAKVISEVIRSYWVEFPGL